MAVFSLPPSSNKGQQRAGVDAEEVAAPEVEPVAPEPAAVIDNPPIAAFHPQRDVLMNQEPFALPCDIPTGRYNLRERSDCRN